MPQDVLRITDRAGAQTGHRILTLDGPLVLSAMFEFQATVRADHSQTLVIDFTGVPYVDSAGIGALVGAYLLGNILVVGWRWLGSAAASMTR
jgi:anti-anti-sigma regulatory factor